MRKSVHIEDDAMEVDQMQPGLNLDNQAASCSTSAPAQLAVVTPQSKHIHEPESLVMNPIGLAICQLCQWQDP
jgi:hypothetical protein